ncbi:hypothetical protein HMPREF9997_02504 [Corynebacterium durum F0235]|uniref:Uncharacterized protein n=1 Tax=Corynebacterium durum F0235 TaxID=1035195 RepID=L1MAR4_9CORY|nr:hypothetical protein HMPREF9997_02504 [Corynebacterium durum F0235]
MLRTGLVAYPNRNPNHARKAHPSITPGAPPGRKAIQSQT